MVWGEGEPIRVPGNSAVEIGRVYDSAPDQLWLHPYLSLNRREIRLDLVDTAPRSLSDEDRFVGNRPSTWTPTPVDGIVVDDLDAGFAWESAPALAARWRLVERYRGWTETLDHGLPVRASQPGAWVRRNVPSSWGKYRRTVAMAFPGGKDYRVFFTAELASGPMALGLLPPGAAHPRKVGRRWRTNDVSAVGHHGDETDRLQRYRRCFGGFPDTRSGMDPRFRRRPRRNRLEQARRVRRSRAARFGLGYRIARLEKWSSPMQFVGAGRSANVFLGRSETPAAGRHLASVVRMFRVAPMHFNRAGNAPARSAGHDFHGGGHRTTRHVRRGVDNVVIRAVTLSGLVRRRPAPTKCNTDA